MKLQASPATSPRAIWKQSIANARSEVELILADSASLRRGLAGVVRDELPRVRRMVVVALADFGETPRVHVELLDDTPDQITGEWWPD